MARRRRRNRSSGGGGLSQLLLGLSLGLAVAAGVYFSDLRSGDAPEAANTRTSRSAAPPSSASAGSNTPAAAADSATPAAPAASAAAAPARTANTGTPTGTTPGTTPGATPGASNAAAPAESNDSGFDFYEMLPRYEVVVPEVEQVARPSGPTAPVAAPGSYILQAGSFRSHADADRMQARLALLGIESRIQKVALDADEFHRVRIGPLDNVDELNRIRASLRQSGIDSLVMKVD